MRTCCSRPARTTPICNYGLCPVQSTCALSGMCRTNISSGCWPSSSSIYERPELQKILLFDKSRAHAIAYVGGERFVRQPAWVHYQFDRPMQCPEPPGEHFRRDVEPVLHNSQVSR